MKKIGILLLLLKKLLKLHQQEKDLKGRQGMCGVTLKVNMPLSTADSDF